MPSVTTGDMCIIPAHRFDDARKCSLGQFNLPVCFRYAPPTVATADWVCLVSPSGKLYVYGAATQQVFDYPGWSFGPAGRTRVQPAFKSTLSPKDEARCEGVLATLAPPTQMNPRFCVDPPGSPRTDDWPWGSVELTVRGMSFTGRVRADDPWSTGSVWNVQAGALTSDPSYAQKGLFFVRWRRDTPPSGQHAYTCEEVELWFPAIPRVGDHESGYHWMNFSGNACPRAPTCQVTVTGLEGVEGYPISGKFSVRNVLRNPADCTDAVDLDGSFTVPHPEL